MAWTSLSDATRFASLPLVLAGPILRRVEANTVSVWIALKESRLIELTIRNEQDIIVLSGQYQTVALGTHLHIAVITANAADFNHYLVTETTYKYTLSAAGIDLTSDPTISYGTAGHPTFSLPPATLSDLRIVHASCRKMHAPGHDALVGVEDMILAEVGFPLTFAKQRPHQLFLTGDQIYADDVSGLQLFLIRDAVAALLGWNETLVDMSDPRDILPGNRASLINDHSGFKFPGEEEIPANHLIFLGEYYCMYLLMWSPVLWPQNSMDYPTRQEVYSLAIASTILPKEDEFQETVANAVFFQQGLTAVRRSLANVPTYMICDDHEITDDWYINLKWCKDVLASTLGSRILQNGLTAFALFQAWGNMPELFKDTESGASNAGKLLLDIIPQWAKYDTENTITSAANIPANATYWQSLYSLIGMPDRAATIAQARLVPMHATHLNFNYHIDWGLHEVFVLDTRNERAFPGGDEDFPALISSQGLTRQLPSFSTSAEITFIIVATPVSGIPNIEEKILEQAIPLTSVYQADAEAYSYQLSGIQSFYAKLAVNAASQQQSKNSTNPARIVVLSGDVHYGFTNRLEFWGSKVYNDTQQSSSVALPAHFVLAQLCASALKNESYSFALSPTLKLKTGTNKGQEDGYVDKELIGPNITLGWVPPSGLYATVGSLGTMLKSGSVMIDDVDFYRVLNITAAPYNVDVPYDSSNLPVFPTRLTLSVQPDWTYRIDYIVALAGDPRLGSLPAKTPIDPALAPAGTQLRSYLDAATNAQTYLHDSYGREAVGRNNIGEIRFSWGTTEATKIIKHQLWWRLEQFLDENHSNTIELPLYPLSEYEVILGTVANKYPKPVF